MRFFTFFVFFITSFSNVFAVERLKSARWFKDLAYGDCNLLGICNLDTSVRSSRKSISLGENITVNFGNGETTSFKVRRIWKDGDTCWLTPSKKRKYKPYLTVGNCR